MMSEQFNDVIRFIREYYHQPEGPIALHEPLFIGNERKYVMDAIDSTFVSSIGKYVDRFESMVKEYTGAGHAVATANGSAALHVALILAGVKRDDLVITQPMTFVATCNVINYVGADPLFIDIDKKTLGLSAAKLKEFLNQNCLVSKGEAFHKSSNRRISACVPMHTFGHPVELDEIMDVCKSYNIVVVEDAAESIGSKYKGKHTGTFGLVSAFSLNGNKTITSGGGGVITTNNATLGKLAKHLTTQAKVPHPWEFNHDHVGYNYRMPNLNAALACAQMEMLDRFIDKKRELANQYKTLFGMMGLEFAVEPKDTYSNYWLNNVFFRDRDERDAFLAYSNAQKISARPVWTLMNKLPMFNNCICGDLSNAQDAENRVISLPSSVKEL
ncbi:MAG: LegC family aminotransferase [Bacteroidetes bacterium]|nr:LegC family aminotransferase [Bacteroidota bacterium]